MNAKFPPIFFIKKEFPPNLTTQIPTKSDKKNSHQMSESKFPPNVRKQIPTNFQNLVEFFLQKSTDIIRIICISDKIRSV